MVAGFDWKRSKDLSGEGQVSAVIKSLASIRQETEWRNTKRVYGAAADEIALYCRSDGAFPHKLPVAAGGKSVVRQEETGCGRAVALAGPLLR